MAVSAAAFFSGRSSSGRGQLWAGAAAVVCAQSPSCAWAAVCGFGVADSAAVAECWRLAPGVVGVAVLQWLPTGVQQCLWETSSVVACTAPWYPCAWAAYWGCWQVGAGVVVSMAVLRLVHVLVDDTSKHVGRLLHATLWWRLAWPVFTLQGGAWWQVVTACWSHCDVHGIALACIIVSPL